VIRLAVYAHVTGGYGTYPLTFILRAADGDTVRRKEAVSPLHHPDPLMVAQLVFEELRVSVPKPGWYDLAFLAGGEQIGRQPLLIGPAEVFRGDGA